MRARAAGPGGAAGGGKRVVISSLTGRPVEWEAEESAPSADDERITRDVPPHWGRGA